MNNIIEFPERRSLRMVKALNAFEAMDNSQLLTDEFRLLAEIGLAKANFYLGCMYENGNNGLPEDISLALEQYELAARKIGLLDAYMAQARLFYHGKGGIEKDLSKAESSYNMAIEQGYVYGMLNLAMLYAEKKMHFSNLIMRVRAGLQAFQVSRTNPRDVRLRGG